MSQTNVFSFKFSQTFFTMIKINLDSHKYTLAHSTLVSPVDSETDFQGNSRGHYSKSHSIIAHVIERLFIADIF